MSLPRRSAAMLALWAVVSVPLGAKFVRPQEIPVDRLVKAADAAVVKTPKSVDAHYTLARVHYLAFVRGGDTVAGLPGPRGDQPAPDWMVGDWIAHMRMNRAVELALDEIGVASQASIPPDKRRAYQTAMERYLALLVKEHWRPSVTQSVADRIHHATVALDEFQIAESLDPKHALSRLGHASLVEQIVDWTTQENPERLPTALAKLDYSDAKKLYLDAYRLAFVDDGKRATLPIQGRGGMVSYETGKAYLRLLENSLALSTDEKSTRSEVEDGLKRLEKIPMGAITPVIFSLEPVSNFDGLLALDRSTNFPLRGYGYEETWPWVKATTGFLVWDPARRGQIDSGQQLFGSYTFQIFRANGYDALAALDDDRDGELRGAELEGIRVWFDTNGDGHSDPGEVRDLAEFEIVAIDTRVVGADGIHPTNPRGILLRNGRWLRTWDWMVSPLSR